MKYFLEPITKHYVDFKGRANRKQFWLWTLWYMIFYILLQVFIGIGGAMDSGFISGLFTIILVVFGLGLLLPNLAIAVRRLHDIGRSGWWLLLSLIPIVGGLVLLVFYVLPGTPQENRFGPVPQA